MTDLDAVNQLAADIARVTRDVLEARADRDALQAALDAERSKGSAGALGDLQRANTALRGELTSWRVRFDHERQRLESAEAAAVESRAVLERTAAELERFTAAGPRGLVLLGLVSYARRLLRR